MGSIAVASQEANISIGGFPAAAPFDTCFRAAAASLQHYSGCFRRLPGCRTLRYVLPRRCGVASALLRMLAVVDMRSSATQGANTSDIVLQKSSCANQGLKH